MTGDPEATLCRLGKVVTPDRANVSEIVAREAVAIFSARTLRTKHFDPLRYVVDGYIAEGCTILAGKPKVGKSWLMLDAALTVATGGTCWGDARCELGDVLYLALEDNERRLRARIAKLLGVSGEWPDGFQYATEWPRADAGGLECIREWIATVPKPRLVVVDVHAMFRTPRDNKQSPYESDYEAIKGLQKIATDTRVSIVIVHHLRKSAAEADPFEKVSGTFGLSAAADTVLILDRDGNGTSLYGRGRDIEEIEQAVEFDLATCRWRILGKVDDVRRSAERTKILSVLTDASEPMSPKRIVEATGMPPNNVAQLLLKMAKDGEISKPSRASYAALQCAA